MEKKKLTGWLVLLIILIGPLGMATGMNSLRTIEQIYKPYMAEFPSLRTAILVFQCLAGLGVVTWLYAAVILYRREVGTLSLAMITFSLGALLRLVAGYSIPLLGGFPPNVQYNLIQQAVPGTFMVICYAAIWLMYLKRSQRVRDIYVA